VGLFPGDDRVSENPDSGDLGFNHVTRSQIQRGRIVTEAGHTDEAAHMIGNYLIADGGYNMIGA
jgi:hypothetical protein